MNEKKLKKDKYYKAVFCYTIKKIKELGVYKHINLYYVNRFVYVSYVFVLNNDFANVNAISTLNFNNSNMESPKVHRQFQYNMKHQFGLMPLENFVEQTEHEIDKLSRDEKAILDFIIVNFSKETYNKMILITLTDEEILKYIQNVLDRMQNQ